MNTHEKAMLTYEMLRKRKLKKREDERQKRQDIDACGWNGYNKSRNVYLKKYYQNEV